MAATAPDPDGRPGLLTGYAALLKPDAAWCKAGQMRCLIYCQALALTLPDRHLFAKLTGPTEQWGDRKP